MLPTSHAALLRAAGRRSSRRTRSHSFHSHVEPLESRHLLSATVIEVDTFDDVIDPDDGFTSLREAVIAANASPGDEEIRLAAGTYTLTLQGSTTNPSEFTANTGDLDILDNGRLRIVGAAGGGTTIDAGGLKDRHFLVRGAEVEFAALTLRGGGVAGGTSGGAIANLEGTVIIVASTFADNRAFVAGALLNADGTIIIERSTFTGNSATFFGGAIVNGSLLLGAAGDLTIRNSSIVGNSVSTTYGSGGGIDNSGALLVDGCTISGNSASLGAGILHYAPSDGGTAVILNSTISNNTASEEGGGLHSLGELTVAHCTLTGNIGGGATLESQFGTTALIHTIVAGNYNAASTAPSDVRGPGLNASASSFNLIGDPATAGGLIHGDNGNIVGDGDGGVLDIDMVLDTTLADNGGPTLTHALVAGSPAFNAGDPAFDPNATDPPLLFDQRGPGFARVFGGRIDIGAVEFGSTFDPVIGRHLFYNNSKFDGKTPGVSDLDDGAIAPDKKPLFADMTQASPENVTSYTRGINGLMIDLVGAQTDVSADDFVFKVGTNNDLDSWTDAPDPLAVVVRPGAGAGGSDRIEIIWADGAIRDAYLQVTVRANDDTGLGTPDVFFFGNKAGDTFTGFSGTFATGVTDEAEVRSNASAAASITNPYDFDRNGFAGASADQFATREFFGVMPAIAVLVDSEATSGTRPALHLRGSEDAVRFALGAGKRGDASDTAAEGRGRGAVGERRAAAARAGERRGAERIEAQTSPARESVAPTRARAVDQAWASLELEPVDWIGEASSDACRRIPSN